MDVLAIAVSWFGLLFIAAGLFSSILRTSEYWSSGAAQRRRLAQTRPERIQFRRNVGTTLFLVLTVVGFFLQYAPSLVGRVDDTLWSHIVPHEVHSNLTLAVLVAAVALGLLLILAVVGKRWPKVVSANLWTLGLLLLEVTIITTLALVLNLYPIVVIGLVLLAVALTFHVGFFYLVRTALVWIQHGLRVGLTGLRWLVLLGVEALRNAQVLITRASDFFRDIYSRSVARVGNAPKSAAEAEVEARLAAAEEKESRGDPTIVDRPKKPRFKRRKRDEDQNRNANEDDEKEL